MGVVKTRECKELKEELESLRIRENESRDKWAGLEKQVTQLSRENDSLREQHLNRVHFDVCVCYYVLVRCLILSLHWREDILLLV